MYIPRILSITFLFTLSLLANALAAPTLSPVASYLVDLQTEVAGVVEVLEVRDDWIVTAEDGGHLAVMRARCRMVEPFAGGDRWAAGTEQQVIHVHQNPSVVQWSAPSLVEGRRYVLWADAIDNRQYLRAGPARWLANPRGFFLLRGPAEDPYFRGVDGKSYSLAATRECIQSNTIIPLDQIDDVARRVGVASMRLDKDALGPLDAYVRGLCNVVEAADKAPGQAENQRAEVQATLDVLAYESIAILRDAGRQSSRRAAVTKALSKLLAGHTTTIRLPAAIALAQLKRVEGRNVMFAALHGEEFPLSKRGKVQLSGRFPFDHSSRQAAAYALGLIDQEQGLRGPDVKLQLAAASGLISRPTPRLVQVLHSIAARFDGEMRRDGARLKAKRAPGDFSARMPADWVLARSLLARLGDDDSLRKLVTAWLVDYATYPERPTTIPPQQGAMTLSTEPDGWPNPLLAIMRSAPNRAALLSRMHRIFTKTWKADRDLGVLRSALGDSTVSSNPAATGAAAPASTDRTSHPDDDTKTKFRHDLETKLASGNAVERAPALAIAGYNRLDDFYPRILTAAREARGDERVAAIFGLGWYERPLTDNDVRAIVDGADSTECRISALELVTRSMPQRYAAQAMYALREILNPREGEKKSSPAAISDIVLVLTRMSRGPTIPEPLREALSDPDERLRAFVVQCLARGGNPAAIPLIRALREKASEKLAAVIDSALQILGPPDD